MKYIFLNKDRETSTLTIALEENKIQITFSLSYSIFY